MTKAKPFVETQVPDLTGKGPDDTISRAELVKMIAEIVYPNLDSATRKHRISSMVTTDRTILRPIGKGRYRLGDISDWTMGKKWEWELFAFLPKNPRIGRGAATWPAPRGSGSGYSGPTSLPEACSQINALFEENLALKRALALYEEQLSRDAPDAKEWRQANVHRTKEYRDSIAK